MDSQLYDLIVDAEAAVRKAHDYSYTQEGRASFWIRAALGRAQSILMSMVVRFANERERSRDGAKC